MNDRILKAILAVIGLVSLASAGAILLFIPPETDQILVPALLSFSLFLVLASATTFLGIGLRKRYINDKNRRRIFTIAFREGVLVSLLLSGYLWLLRFKIFNLWSAVVPFVLILVLEYYCLARFSKTRGV